MSPVDQAVKGASQAIDFSWTENAGVAFYRIEIENSKEQPDLSALLPAKLSSYRAPSWLKEKPADGNLRWRVLAFNQSANKISETGWRKMQLSN